MSEPDSQPRLSDISTQWSLVFQAHRATGNATKEAQTILMERYFGAVYRYFLRVAGNAEAADELSQDFALRFVRGDFHHADPNRGRFRDYVKTAVRNMLHDYAARPKEKPRVFWDSHVTRLGEVDSASRLDDDFASRWRDELLECAWRELEAIEQQTGTRYFTALRWRTEQPDAPTSQLGQDLKRRTGDEFTDSRIRQLLHRGREKFATLLLAEVARSLENPSDVLRIEEELAELRLLEYCRVALATWKDRY